MPADFFRAIDRNIGILPTMNRAMKTEMKRGPTMAILIPIAALVAGVILQAWVVPRFGVKT
jgi:hypothetical protein